MTMYLWQKVMVAVWVVLFFFCTTIFAFRTSSEPKLTDRVEES